MSSCAARMPKTRSPACLIRSNGGCLVSEVIEQALDALMREIVPQADGTRVE